MVVCHICIVYRYMNAHSYVHIYIHVNTCPYLHMWCIYVYIHMCTCTHTLYGHIGRWIFVIQSLHSKYSVVQIAFVSEVSISDSIPISKNRAAAF